MLYIGWQHIDRSQLMQLVVILFKIRIDEPKMISPLTEVLHYIGTETFFVALSSGDSDVASKYKLVNLL